jgi:hypothetical protein
LSLLRAKTNVEKAVFVPLDIAVSQFARVHTLNLI